MLGLVLLYFIWKRFSELAARFEKKRWPYIILGIVSYYAGAFLIGVVFVLIEYATGWSFIEKIPDIVYSLIALPSGLLSCWGTYKMLERSWSNQSEEEVEDFDELIDTLGVDTHPGRDLP